MRVKELMQSEVIAVGEDDLLDDVVDVLVEKHLSGAPVVDATGELVGVVSQWDVYFGSMTRNREQEPGPSESGSKLAARDIMTSPAFSATEETEIVDLCRMMAQLRIHRVPVVRERKLIGIVSSLDVCGAVASQRLGAESGDR